jgi:hypothetical protein
VPDCFSRTERVHDLDAIAFVQPAFSVPAARHDFPVHLDRDAAFAQASACSNSVRSQGWRATGFAIQDNVHVRIVLARGLQGQLCAAFPPLVESARHASMRSPCAGVCPRAEQTIRKSNRGETMKKPARRLLAAALALAAAPAVAGPFTNTVFFGDSLTDSGFYRPFLVEVAGRAQPSPAASPPIPAWCGRNTWPTTTALRRHRLGTHHHRHRRRCRHQLRRGGATIVPAPASRHAADPVRTVADGADRYVPQPQRWSADAECAVHGLGRRQRSVLHTQGLTTPQQFLRSAQAQVGWSIR